METVIAALVAFGAFALFFAVFLIKRRRGDEPIKVHTCAREKCNCEERTDGVQILERMDESNG